MWSSFQKGRKAMFDPIVIQVIVEIVTWALRGAPCLM
jgi:hypothetical protein